MRILVIIFGGADYKFIEEFNCTNLMQKEFGKVTVDNLWKNRDVATQITSQLISGKSWEKSGIKGRKKYTNPIVEKLEKQIFKKYKIPFQRKTGHLREGFYNTFSTLSFKKRNYLKEDFKCNTLFEMVHNSKAVYVPSYNPEPSWALRRNILDPRAYPEFGIRGALDLLEKNFFWRKKRFFESLKKNYQLLITQFQFIDSLQHLYLVYTKKPQMEKIKEGYYRIEDLVKEIKNNALNYDMILFISDNGAAHEKGGSTHYNRPFYSINHKKSLVKTNIRDFYYHIINWIKSQPNKGKVNDEGFI